MAAAAHDSGDIDMKNDRLGQVLSRAKSLDIGAWSRAWGTMTGAYRSKVLDSGGGDGMEFEEVREYAVGDDPRRIDWNVSARYGGIYVKEFVAERDLDVYVAVDLSESTAFGGVKSKRDVMVEIGASLVLSALRDNNRVGLGIFAERLERFVPAKKGRLHAMQIIREMTTYGADAVSGARTDLAGSLVQIAGRMRRKCTMFVISDFVTGSFEAEVRRIASRHTVVMVGVSDARERVLPDVGYAWVEDAETGAQALVDTSDKGFQEAYERMVADAADLTQRQARRAGADYVEITGDEPFDVAINRHASMLNAARAGARGAGRGRNRDRAV